MRSPCEDSKACKRTRSSKVIKFPLSIEANSMISQVAFFSVMRTEDTAIFQRCEAVKIFGTAYKSILTRLHRK